MIKKSILLCLFLSCSVFAMGPSSVVPDPVPCLHDLEIHFFNREIVDQALSLYQIPQGLWSPIEQTLQQRSLSVPNLLKQKTALMVPNPIEYPLQKEATAKLLKQVLFDVFLQTMREYQVQERPTVDFMFDYIYLKQLPLLERCLGKQPAPIFD